MSDVSIDLAGESVALPCTVDAAKSISGFFGNIVEAYKRVGQFDFTACCFVVASVTGKKIADVEAPVFEAGLETIVPALLKYLVRLTNGGRDITAAAPMENDQ